MLKDKTIVCISSIDWDFIWQGHQEIMSTLAANGNKVLFIENTGVRSPNLRDLPRLKKRIHNWLHSAKGMRRERENIFIYSPIILPFPYSRIARLINRRLLIGAVKRWLTSTGSSNPIVWTFLPTGLVLDIIDAIDNELVLYYCIDNFSASSAQARKIQAAEEKVLRRADMVFVTAKNLYDKCARHNDCVHIFPYGVNVEVYEKACGGSAPAPQDVAAIQRPIVGYVGGVHKWIDYELVRFLAESNKDKSFVFVGPVQSDVGDLQRARNVHFLGQKRYEDLPLYVSQFDVCIIPYLLTDYTRNVYPTKMNEYLMLGKPVVATAIPEVEAFDKRNSGTIFIGRTKEDFSGLINRAISERASKETHAKRLETAVREGSWKAKIEEMSKLIEKKIADKERERSKNWKEYFLMLYNKSKRSFVLTSSALAILYIALFQTPLIWLIGKPLKVSDALKKADAIVVLAGGVGESGRAGQGYEERTQYGVDLYKKGYAPRIIFSSGYRYVIKEAEIMRALAVSMGVPNDSIMLEERAANTYENILFASAILRENHHTSAIVVSAPYNMLRVSLVAKKNAPDISFVYAPVPRSVFYGSEGRVQPKHIAAIVHEYVGIVYYFFKGYI